MDRLLKINGYGKINVKADQMNLIFTMKGVDDAYQNVLLKSTIMHETLLQNLNKLGIEESNIITESFDISQNMINVLIDGKNKTVQDGYKFYERIKVSFPFDNYKLNEILQMLNDSRFYTDFSIAYSLQNPDKYHSLALEKAIENVKNVASTISKNFGMELDNIASIKYGIHDYNTDLIVPAGVRLMSSNKASSKEIGKVNLVSKDIVIDEYIEVEYFIK